MKLWGGDLQRDIAIRRAYRENPSAFKKQFAKVNLAEGYEKGELSDFDVKQFINRLGKDKIGGILTFEVVVPKKFAKYLPKKKLCVLAELGDAIYAANVF